ncbi:type II toxin-antitoxin system HicA family toxin [Candidatus Woesearchaeota archaeon]|nr:type II toxin-antitoxin system HicA family toxin [Candidatus Woesearchaeota archaeon]
MKLPRVSGKEMIAFLQKQGFDVKRQRGSHVTLYKKSDEGKGLYATVPLHANKEIFSGTLLSILKQANITKEEFLKLIK